MRDDDVDRFASGVGHHGFAGLDRFAGCWVASCGCGWSGTLEGSEDGALSDYGSHLSATAGLPLVSPWPGTAPVVPHRSRTAA